MKSLTKSIIVATAVAGVFTAQAQTFTDSTFNSGDWSKFVFIDGSGTVAGQQTATGGNPGPARLVTNTLGANSAVAAAHFYDPIAIFTGPGGLGRISYSLDVLAPSFAMGVGLALYQDGFIYVADYSAVFSNEWQTKSASNLTESMFGRISLTSSSVLDMSSNPDFDLVNSEITLGFFTANSGGPAVIEGVFDNYSVSIEAVPEPATMALLAIPALAALRKKKSR